MGSFRSIGRKTATSLETVFPMIFSCDGDFELVMNAARISIFDHYLEADEALKLIDCIDSSERDRRDDIWRRFNKLLIQGSPCYRIKWRKAGRPLFKEPRSPESLLTAMEPTTSIGLSLVFPEYGAIYQQYWDDTHLLFFLDTVSVQPLMSIARQSGLNILPW